MPATEQTTDLRAGELDRFFLAATRELKASVSLISIYSALLDAQLSEDPSLAALRAIVQEVRTQAGVVAALVDHALQTT
jgi:translation initiation factor RLI1